IGAGRLKSLMDLAADLRTGAVTTLLVLGADGVLVGDTATSTMQVDKLSNLVVLSTHNDRLVDAAHVSLPMAAWAEVDGTFTNKLGMVQRIRAALPPAGDALPGWEIVTHLGRGLGVALEFTTAKSVFTEAKQRLAFMKDADWGRAMLPVQMR